MANDLVTWLTGQLNDRGWSQAELSRRAGLDTSTISLVMSEQRNAGFEFCVKVAGALGEEYPLLLEMAGLVPDSPPAVHEEREILAILRALSPTERQTALSMLRGLRNDAAPTASNHNATESHEALARRVVREEIARQEAERRHVISTLLSGLEAAGVNLAQLGREAEHCLLLQAEGKETREEGDTF